MEVFKTIEEYSNWRNGNPAHSSGNLGFVPTMGSLHPGHLSLIDKCTSENDITVVSIFINPIQFNDKKDFQNYPVDIDSDLKKCEDRGVTAVFVPKTKKMYTAHHGTYCNVPDLENTLCGLYRPGHFRGVCTVVLKLFNIIRPTTAYFGQKDFQQACIIRQMVQDLNVNVGIEVRPTQREASGLALSSRNALLTPENHEGAGSIFQGLEHAKDAWVKGERVSANLIGITEKFVKESEPDKIEYISVVRQSDLQPVDQITESSLIALAVYYGDVRLIDNILLDDS